MPPPARATEPALLKEGFSFEEGDFHALSEALATDPDANARRLVARRKLLTLGKEVARRGGLECRTSLHHPHVFNGMRVRRLWAYVTRTKAEKAKLKRVLGSELGKDLDSAHKNAYLCLALEAEALEVSLRIHPEGWYDGQNLKNKVEKGGQLPAWRDVLNALDGFRLTIADWKGEWRCGELTIDALEEYLSFYTPGEHRLAVVRRWPAPAGARGPALDAGVPAALVEEALRLVPLLAFAGWAPENDFLFG